MKTEEKYVELLERQIREKDQQILDLKAQVSQMMQNTTLQELNRLRSVEREYSRLANTWMGFQGRLRPTHDEIAKAESRGNMIRTLVSSLADVLNNPERFAQDHKTSDANPALPPHR
jgi:hypothetical protein